MSETEDARRLAKLLKQQRELVIEIGQLRDTNRIDEATVRLEEVRRDCLTLVDRYFRQVLQPVLIRRFPNKVTHSGDNGRAKAPVGVVVQFTQLLNDFFVQVLSKNDDPFWKKTSAIELRNYSSIVISNHGVRDALRRRKKQIAPYDAHGGDLLENQLAQEIEARFLETGIDPADAVDVINRWEQSNEALQRQHARLLRLRYIAGMSMEEVASDMETSPKTAYRWHQEALDAVRDELRTRI